MRSGSAIVLAICLSACVGTKKHHAPSASAPSTTTSPATRPPSPPLVLAHDGRANVVIFAPERLQAAPPEPRPKRLSVAEKQAKQAEKQLAEAVADLARYLERISGAEVAVAYGQPPDVASNGVVPILIGELGEQRMGPVTRHIVGKQGFHFYVQKSLVALYGESDLATSYAIYELLDRLGCRWFMPGELGEQIPTARHLEVAQADESLAPSTLYRNVWYGDEAYKRRNRLGGVSLAAGHLLETWISEDQRKEHPEWRAEIKGQPQPRRLRWSNPEVADAIAIAIDARLAKQPAESISISPGDGSDFDDGVDKQLDAGDWDPSVNGVSLTDRLMVLANRVASKLAPQHPDLMLGLIAYSSYTRPPVREAIHPNVVPTIAPITYCRTRPLSDDRCPGATELRAIVDGWSSRAQRWAFRGYLFNLSEPSAPNPMMHKWSEDLPFLLERHVSFLQPETMPTFETNLPALYLTVRLSWDAQRKPATVLNEIFESFYGHAGPEVRAYLELIDGAWLHTDEFSGSDLGYARLFRSEVLAKARQAMERAKSACQTDVERRRVAMLDESLAQFELYMRIRADFRSGRLGTLAEDFARWLDTSRDLSEKYAENSAFGQAGWTRGVGIYGAYAKRFLGPAYAEADRIHREQEVLTPTPLCRMRYALVPDASVPLPAEPRVLRADDKQMDVCTETWSTLGQDGYFGAMQYQATFDAAATPRGKQAFLWLSKVDGIAQVWLNGVLVRPKENAPAKDGRPTSEGHLVPLTFDVTHALRPAAANELTIVVKRTALAELGAGGLLGPVYVYRER